MDYKRYSYAVLSGAAGAQTTSIVDGHDGMIHGIFPTGGTGSVQVYDGTGSVGGATIFGPCTFVAGNPVPIILDAWYTKGLYVTLTNYNGTITIVYK